MKSMDRKAFEEVKKAYIEGIREKIIKYKKLVDKRNLSEIQRLGHSLKGSGTMYGYPEISTFGKKVESLAKSGNWTQIKQTIKGLKAIYEKIKGEKDR